MKNSPYSDFIKHVKTNKEYKNLLGKLEDIRARSFKKDGSFEKNVEEVFGTEEGKAFIAICKEEGVLPSNPVAMTGLIDKITQSLHGLTIAKISLAFLPTRNTVDIMSSWFEEQIGARVIIDISVDPSILAGVVIEAGGFYKDYSLRQRLDSIVNI